MTAPKCSAHLLPEDLSRHTKAFDPHPPQHRDPLTVPSASGVPATKPEPPTVPTETADQTGPGPKGKAYQCSVYTVDRLGMKTCPA